METLKLQATERHGVYTATIAGKPAVVAMTQRDRAKAEFVNRSVTVSDSKIRPAQKLASQSGAAFYVAVAVSVQGKFKQAVAVPYELFKGIKQSTNDFPLNEKILEAFAKNDDVLKDWRPEISEFVIPLVPRTGKPVVRVPAKQFPLAVAPTKVDMRTPGWTDAEEREIARLQETEGLSRKSAVQKMRRAAKQSARLNIAASKA
jgi:hypothetical protein